MTDFLVEVDGTNIGDGTNQDEPRLLLNTIETAGQRDVQMAKEQ